MGKGMLAQPNAQAVRLYYGRDVGPEEILIKNKVYNRDASKCVPRDQGRQGQAREIALAIAAVGRTSARRDPRLYPARRPPKRGTQNAVLSMTLPEIVR
jgi:hypothetical protein